MDPASLFVGLLVSLVGTAYMVYRRKQGHPIALLCGLGWCWCLGLSPTLARC